MKFHEDILNVFLSYRADMKAWLKDWQKGIWIQVVTFGEMVAKYFAQHTAMLWVIIMQSYNEFAQPQ